MTREPDPAVLREFAKVVLTIDATKLVEAMNNAARQMHGQIQRMRGQRELARVIVDQPGRRIVREGMTDILEWIGEKP